MQTRLTMAFAVVMALPGARAAAGSLDDLRAELMAIKNVVADSEQAQMAPIGGGLHDDSWFEDERSSLFGLAKQRFCLNPAMSASRPGKDPARGNLRQAASQAPSLLRGAHCLIARLYCILKSLPVMFGDQRQPALARIPSAPAQGGQADSCRGGAREAIMDLADAGRR